MINQENPFDKKYLLSEKETDLRDKFANSAMQSLFTNQTIADTMTDYSIEWVAKFSYLIADAMLKQRLL